MGGLRGGLTWGLEKTNSLVLLELPSFTGGLFKNKKTMRFLMVNDMFITTKHHVYHREDDVYNFDYTPLLWIIEWAYITDE